MIDLYSIKDIIIISFSGLALVAAGFLIARFSLLKKYKNINVENQKRLFTIERALRDFWDSEKLKLEREKEDLQKSLSFLRSQNENLRNKLSKMGLFNFGRSKRANLLLSLLIENEALEERLFQMNLKLKEERDEYLRREISNISYNKVLLSEILAAENVQKEVTKLLKDNSRMKKIQIKALGDAPQNEASQV